MKMLSIPKFSRGQNWAFVVLNQHVQYSELNRIYNSRENFGLRSEACDSRLKNKSYGKINDFLSLN